MDQKNQPATKQVAPQQIRRPRVLSLSFRMPFAACTSS